MADGSTGLPVRREHLPGAATVPRSTKALAPYDPDMKDSGTGTTGSGVLSIECFTLGPFETNCYVVSEGGAAEGAPCWVIDASFEPRPIIDHLRRKKWRPELLILTHAHVDHIAGVAEVKQAFPDISICIHPAEREWLGDPVSNLSALSGSPVISPEAELFLSDGDTLKLGGSAWRVLHTPGHSPGGITLVDSDDRCALVGDTLFAGSVGRTDFPGCDHGALMRSISERLYVLPDQTRVYPGHGPETTIGRERRNNPFVRG